MRFCEECGAQLEDDAKFCEECGTEVVLLEEEDEISSGPEESAEPVALFCEECGAKLEPGTRFCEECGTPVGEIVEVEEETEISEDVPMEVIEETVEEETIGKIPEEEAVVLEEAVEELAEEATVEEVLPEKEPEIEVVEELSEEESVVEIEKEEETEEFAEENVEVEPEAEMIPEVQEEPIEEIPEEVPVTEPIVAEQKEITPPIIEKHEVTKQPKNKLVGVLIAIIGVLLVVIVALVLLGLNKFGLDDKEKEVSSGNNVVVGEDNTDTTTTPEVIVTSTPVPTATPKPTAVPTKKPTATPIPTPEELYETTAPIWRDVLTDSEDIKRLKKEIRWDGTDVGYFFKDRMKGEDLITQLSELETQAYMLQGVNVYSYQTKRSESIDAEVCVLQGGLVQISWDYLNTLPDGYYDIVFSLYIKKRDSVDTRSQKWYVAQSDVYQEPEQWLYDCHKTYKKNYECVSVVVRPDSSEKIVKLTWKDGTEIDKALYEILYEGRVLNLSPELMQRCGAYRKQEFLVHSVNGRVTEMDVKIESLPEPTPTPTPLPTATPTPKPTLEEINRMTAPEWRENEADSNKVKAMKESVRSGNITVEHFFKNRAEGKGLIIHEPKIDDPGVRFDELRVYSYETNEEKVVDKKYYQIQEDLIIISEAFLDSLSDGFYITYHIMSQKGAEDKQSIVMSQTWYIAENDVYQEPKNWLYWNNPAYKDYLEYTNVTVRADSTKVISKLIWDDGSDVDKSLYEINFDGRVLRISKALLQQCVKLNKWEFDVCSMDGSKAHLRFWPE